MGLAKRAHVEEASLEQLSGPLGRVYARYLDAVRAHESPRAGQTKDEAGAVVDRVRSLAATLQTFSARTATDEIAILDGAIFLAAHPEEHPEIGRRISALRRRIQA